MIKEKFGHGRIIKINKEEINKLKHRAQLAALRRARLCLHKNEKDPLQEMVIVLCKNSYIRPHRHKEKDESIHVIEGAFYLVIFNANGLVSERIFVKQNGSQGHIVCRVKENVWHTIIPLSDFVVFHEVIRGPFRGPKSREFASWAPEEGKIAKEFINTILTKNA